MTSASGHPARVSAPGDPARVSALGDPARVSTPGDPARVFAPGDAVRVRDDWPETRGPVHIRTPHYLRGVGGRVARYLGDFPNPEDLAFGRPAQRLPLYHVAFDRNAIWADHPANDTLLVEIYGHWLEAP